MSVAHVKLFFRRSLKCNMKLEYHLIFRRNRGSGRDPDPVGHVRPSSVCRTKILPSIYAEIEYHFSNNRRGQGERTPDPGGGGVMPRGPHYLIVNSTACPQQHVSNNVCRAGGTTIEFRVEDSFCSSRVYAFPNCKSAGAWIFRNSAKFFFEFRAPAEIPDPG